ncbi:MAG: tRNA pseudouridine(38-40) synthase TruA [Candidatus Brocadiia bacterium]
MSDSLPPSDLVRFAAVVEYDGTNYCGWQVQANEVTIQQRLEEALRSVYSLDVRVTGAGRTDSGVHAVGQVCHFDVPPHIPSQSIRDALNHHLPPDISVFCVTSVPDSFHARFSAHMKQYSYRILTSPVRSVFDRSRAWQLYRSLDPSRVADAAKLFEGEHDFTAFTTEPETRESCIRKISSIDVLHQSPYFLLAFRAQGFLYNLVRAITGALVFAGKGKVELDVLRTMLSGGRREPPIPLAPAHGLRLDWIEYAGYPALRRRLRDD